jgi:ankyrin repeat protein
MHKDRTRSWKNYYITVYRDLERRPVLEDKFLYASSTDLDKKIKEYVEMGADPTVNTNAGLLTAIRTGNIPLAIYLISKGADIHFMDNFALEVAVQYGNLNMLKWLVEVIKMSLNGRTDLMENAIVYRHPELVRYLADKGVPITTHSLSKIVYTGDIDLLKYAVSKGADLRADNDKIFQDSPYSKNLDMVKYLISQGVNIHANKDEVLFYAVRASTLDILKYLIEELGMDPHTKNDKLLDSAIILDFYEGVKYLIEEQGLIPSVDALEEAAENDDEEMVKYLISQGANPETLSTEARETYGV